MIHEAKDTTAWKEIWDLYRWNTPLSAWVKVQLLSKGPWPSRQSAWNSLNRDGVDKAEYRIIKRPHPGDLAPDPGAALDEPPAGGAGAGEGDGPSQKRHALPGLKLLAHRPRRGREAADTGGADRPDALPGWPGSHTQHRREAGEHVAGEHVAGDMLDYLESGKVNIR